MKEQLEQIKARALQALKEAKESSELEALRVSLLGKKGELTAVLKSMGKLSAEERPVMGQLANSVRASIEERLEQRKKELAAAALEAKLEAEAVDVTIPGEAPVLGHKHPMNIALDEAKEIFIGMGFQILEGPEVELADYNFTKLNTEEGHPARDWSDTFYLKEDSSVLLRTQTSPMQVRAMEAIKEPPIRILAPGRVFRKDEVDATHSPMFRGPGHRQGHHHGGPEGHPGNPGQVPLRRGLRGAVPSPPLPLHRAQLRGGRTVLQVPRRRLPHLQGRGLDRAAGRRHGAPQGPGGLRH